MLCAVLVAAENYKYKEKKDYDKSREDNYRAHFVKDYGKGKEQNYRNEYPQYPGAYYGSVSDFRSGFVDYPTLVDNAYRQEQVNNIARSIGSGTGTAELDGVPGTVLARNGYAGYAGYNGGYNGGYTGRNGYRYNDYNQYNQGRYNDYNKKYSDYSPYRGDYAQGAYY